MGIIGWGTNEGVNVIESDYVKRGERATDRFARGQGDVDTWRAARRRGNDYCWGDGRRGSVKSRRCGRRGVIMPRSASNGDERAGPKRRIAPQWTSKPERRAP